MQEHTHIHNANLTALRAGLTRRPPASPRLRRSCAEPSRRRYQGMLEASSTRLYQEPQLIPAGGSWVRAVVHHGGHSPGLLSEPPYACRLRPIGPPTGAIADNKNSFKSKRTCFWTRVSRFSYKVQDQTQTHHTSIASELTRVVRCKANAHTRQNILKSLTNRETTFTNRRPEGYKRTYKPYKP